MFDKQLFKDIFRITRATFCYTLGNIREALERETLVEEPIPPELGLAVCLYRLGRGDYLYTALGNSTVCSIVIEVCEEIIKTVYWTL